MTSCSVGTRAVYSGAKLTGLEADQYPLSPRILLDKAIGPQLTL
jgi:hypothetical protein